jgi:hypothetical protein|tara:strand:+ start:8887 stop:9120 length:234 start_codon:yes stop_codon:yes gene_type:complete
MGVGLNKTVKVCSNDYAEPPEGIPVWCVEQDLSLEAGIQLGLEAILLIVVFLVFRAYFLRRNRKRIEAENLEVVGPS